MEQTSDYSGEAYQSRMRQDYESEQTPVPAADRLFGQAGRAGLYLLGVLGLLNVATSALGDLAHPSSALTLHAAEELLFSVAMIKLGDRVGRRAQERQETRDHLRAQQESGARPPLSDLGHGPPRPHPEDVHAEMGRDRPHSAPAPAAGASLEGDDFDWPSRDDDDLTY